MRACASTIADTSSIGFSMVTGGSRTTFATGKAVIEAAGKVVALIKERRRPDLGRRGRGALTGAPAKRSAAPATTPASAWRSSRWRRRAPFAGGAISAVAAINADGWLPGFAVHICDTEVDPETGHVRIARYTAIQDVGRAIHPDYVEGQIQGGTVQGIGWALNESYVYDANGRLDNPGFLDYRMPVASDLPMIEAVMIEVPNPDHPYGVKGVGEVPIVPPLAAVANAIADATGVRLRDLPMSPDRVYMALRAAEQAACGSS